MKKFEIKDKYFIRKNLKIKEAASFKQILEENSDVLFNEDGKVGDIFTGIWLLVFSLYVFWVLLWNKVKVRSERAYLCYYTRCYFLNFWLLE